MFVILPLLLIMGGALFWGGQRIIRQEQERIAVDFQLLTRYMSEQQALLRRLAGEPILEDNNATQASAQIFRLMNQQQALGATLFQGSPSPVETPFTLVCEDMAQCPLDSAQAAALGRYLADLYSSFWVRSSYPASALLVVDAGAGSTYTVPTIGSSHPLLSAALAMASIKAIRSSATGRDEIRWIHLEDFPEQMVAFTPLRNLPLGNGMHKTYAATLTYRDRINVFSRPLQRNFYDAFWLESQHDGLLLGERPPPTQLAREVNLRSDGLVFRVSDDSGIWTGYYLLTYRTLFLGHTWPLAGVLLVLLLSPLGGRSYARWYQRRVIVPAQRAHTELVENDQFSRTLLETTPVALCVLSREHSRIVFANNLALKWFDTQVGQSLEDSGLEHGLLALITQARAPGEVENYQSPDGRSFYIAYAPTRYRNQEVLICAFADLSARAQMEQQLTLAKQAADKANGAKSVFLATMSHEIRTPLYGVLGSLELMGLTDLDREQRQLLERIQVSSALLLQIISDILDITRIESGQLSLGDQPFDPRALVQRCTAAFIDSARNKGLLLFSWVDPALPQALLGDPGRISQILTNLISNAIKFTHSGQVIVRARAEPGSQGRTLLSLQVADTGIGIGQEEQQQLFIPFYQIDAHSHTVHGAGLGLSICAKLAALMGSQIQLTSELGLGSSFSLQLELPAASEPLGERQPQLSGARVYVQSPHHELTDNLCQWLEKWGARASPLEGPGLVPRDPGILLRLLGDSPEAPPQPDPGMIRIDLGGQHQGPAASLAEACDFSAIGRLIERSLGRGADAPGASPEEVAALPALGLNVLVAEDNPINQATLSHQLQQLGCRSTLAADGAEALDLWRVGDYDLLLTDVNMPRMNGYELTCILRASGDDRPIIGITANAMCDEEARCQAAGMDAWLVKPVPLQTLRSSLARLTQLDPPEDAPGPCANPQAPSLPSNLRQIFTSTMAVDLEQLQQAIDRQDYQRIFYLLHRIRGSLAVTGYNSLIQQLEALGQSLRQAGLTTTTRANSLTLLHALQDISQPD